MSKTEFILFIIFSVLIIAGLICFAIAFWLTLVNIPTMIAFYITGSILLIIGLGGIVTMNEIIARDEAYLRRRYR